MSIKSRYINLLKKEFVFDTEKYKTLLDRKLKLIEEIREIIEKDSLKDVLKEDLPVLERFTDFWGHLTLHLGKSFSERYGGMKTSEIFYNISSDYVTLKIPVNYKENLGENIEKLLPELIPKNDEILQIRIDLKNTLESFDRLINTRTSMTFLKNTFPDIYKKLKEYEKDTSI